MQRSFKIISIASIAYSILSTIQCVHMAARYDYAQNSLVQGSQVLNSMVEDFSTYRDTVIHLAAVKDPVNVIYRVKVVYIKTPVSPIIQDAVKEGFIVPDSVNSVPIDTLQPI